MSKSDRKLGMNTDISRRDFLNGVSVAIGASLLPACTKTGAPDVEKLSAYYPPAEMGMRGSNLGRSKSPMLRSRARNATPTKSTSTTTLWLLVQALVAYPLPIFIVAM